MTDEPTLDMHAKIQHAAFEAAYMETPNPDPASRRFVDRVATHAERLWVEHQACQCEDLHVSEMVIQSHAAMEIEVASRTAG